jgi:GNAT superfamily N-acetyltransferase
MKSSGRTSLDLFEDVYDFVNGNPHERLECRSGLRLCSDPRARLARRSCMTSAPVLRLDAAFEQWTSLEDGRRVRLRWIVPADADLLRLGFARLSMASRLTRFFAPLHALSDDAIRYLTQVDGINHAALVAVSAPGDGPSCDERGFGVARFVRLAGDPRRAEVAVTVVDEAQGQGLGRQLLAAIAIAAQERGVETFTMYVLWSSARVRRLLLALGAERRGRDGDLLEYAVATSALAGRALAAQVAHAPRAL